MTDDFDFADFLNNRMTDLSITNQNDYAKFLGISPSALSRYLQGGKPSLDILVQVAEVFHLELLGVPREITEEVVDIASEADVRRVLSSFPGLTPGDVDELFLLIQYKATKRVAEAHEAKRKKD